MNRRAFVTRGCACVTLLLAGTARSLPETSEAQPKGETKPAVEDLTQSLNPAQVMAVLSDIDRSGDSRLTDAVFTRWGNQCFQSSSRLKEFVAKQKADFPGYVERVNSGRNRYWERLDYDPAKGILKITSRKFGKCICAYAQCSQPARALCTHCCKAFQAEFFRAMTGREVTVQIDEGILLGGERCRTTVYLR